MAALWVRQVARSSIAWSWGKGSRRTPTSNESSVQSSLSLRNWRLSKDCLRPALCQSDQKEQGASGQSGGRQPGISIAVNPLFLIDESPKPLLFDSDSKNVRPFQLSILLDWKVSYHSVFSIDFVIALTLSLIQQATKNIYYWIPDQLVEPSPLFIDKEKGPLREEFPSIP